MKVREILACAAELCGRKDLADFLAGRSGENAAAAERECETLLRCYNMTENEVALDYLPLRREEELHSEGAVPYAAFSAPPVEIFSVRGEGGEKLPFRADEEGLRVRAGRVRVCYSSRPKVKGIGEEAELSRRGDGRLLALGTACEFALLSGMTEEAALLDKKFRDALACACRERGGRLMMRRWA